MSKTVTNFRCNIYNAENASILIKAATYDGTTSWLDYNSHFEACAGSENWSEEENALYLAVPLRGQAQSVL